MVKAALAVVLIALLATPLAAMPAAGEERRPADRLERYVPLVETGPTARWGGGQFVHVRMGDVTFSVVWSENASLPSGVRMLIDYRRFFGAAELYDAQGDYLRTMGLPLHTVVSQEFDRMIEFRDTDADFLFDFHGVERKSFFMGDLPVKVLNLRTAWHLDGGIEQVVVAPSAWVNFTLRTDALPYDRVFDSANQTWRNGTVGDGVLDSIALTFRLTASAHSVRAEVPFYRVTLASREERFPVRSEFLGNRTVTGVNVAVNGKYDQHIEGWDFGFTDSKLALATPFGFGNFTEAPIVAWLRARDGAACVRDGGFQRCETDPEEVSISHDPVARDRLQMAEGWRRAGDVDWVSDVTVDGRPARMTFEISHIERAGLDRGDRIYRGFRAFGAFVYPQGQSIVHDPELSASTVYAGLPEPTNLAPSFLVGLQLAVVAIALVPAVLLRRRARKGER